MYRRQPYDYAFKLQVINYYATAGINATISRFFYITDDDPKGSTRMFVLKRKQQRAQIEQRAGKQQLPAINAIKHTGQTALADALKKAAAFAHEVARRVDVEGIKTIYNDTQTAVFFELLPRTTTTNTGSKTVRVKFSTKEKEQMTVMVPGESHGLKYPLDLVMKSGAIKIFAVDVENKRMRHGFRRRPWIQIEPLQDKLDVHGNRKAWWTTALAVEFLRFHFGQCSVFSDPVMLLLDDFSGHWVHHGLTWLCQPADAVWIKLMKDRLRRLWLLHLQGQIANHRVRPTALTSEIMAPNRVEGARWESNAWKDIPTFMVAAGFAHCKL
uniref:AlNc14C145G7375 protein n=1 Tax=Albugo laibachii Nc14 TaxID=890382 RepID=F0WLI8_9STRA|nr:AlNc14C145G7375 [Albugo laibachii Nc14]|eukprot:CCA22151.1 AlNc14C145G7375 [Albugo laibachii Nc14]